MVDRVGPDVTRFHMLTRKNDAALDFDFDKVVDRSKENPVFYVQYAHARVCSVLRQAEDVDIATDDAAMAAAICRSWIIRLNCAGPKDRGMAKAG